MIIITIFTTTTTTTTTTTNQTTTQGAPRAGHGGRRVARGPAPELALGKGRIGSALMGPPQKLYVF